MELRYFSFFLVVSKPKTRFTKQQVSHGFTNKYWISLQQSFGEQMQGNGHFGLIWIW
jgi:hypothetical protein